ncbi:MAG: hypothetical protein ABFD64_06855 [Armatimonadota bacterium]
MSEENITTNRSTRPLLLIALLVIFAGIILYSTFFVKYNAGKSSKSEFTITELSLTHSVIRGKDGKLEVPAENPSISKDNKKSGKSKSGGKACPT